MLHTNFQSQRPFSSREDDYVRILPYMNMTAIFNLVMWSRPVDQTFVPLPMEASHKIWLQSAIGKQFLRKGKNDLDLWYSYNMFM